MSLEELLNKLKLDTWYSILIYVGAIGFLGSIFLPVQIFDQKGISLFMLGLFFIGLGEMKNYKHKSWIKEANVFTGGPALMKAKIREPDFIGYALIFVGFVLILLSVLNIFSLTKI